MSMKMSPNVTLVLIPGLLCDETVWQPLLADLDGQITVHIPDLSQQNDLTQMAQDILVECPGNLYVAGHSMGARVALEVVRLASERVQKLALLNTGVHPYKPGEEIKRNQLVKLAYDQGMQALAEQWLPPMVFAENHNNQALMDGLFQMVERKTSQVHEQQIHALLNRRDATPGLAAITCPTLVLVGAEDQWSPVAQHEVIHTQLPHSELVVVDKAGHFAPVEQPEVVNAALRKWMEG